MTKHLILTAACIAAFYLIGAFIAWDWNPEHWSTDGRAFLASIGVVMTAFANAGVAGV